jgi:hypothetical protein
MFWTSKDPNRVGPLPPTAIISHHTSYILACWYQPAMASTRDIEADTGVVAEGAMAGVAGSIGKDDATLTSDTTTCAHESPIVFCEPEVNLSTADASAAETPRPLTEAASPEEHCSCQMVCPMLAKLGEFALLMCGVAFGAFCVFTWLLALGEIAFSAPITFAAIALAIALAIIGCKCWDRYGKKKKDGAMTSIRDPEADVAVAAEGDVADEGSSIGCNDARLPSGKVPEEADIYMDVKGDSIGKDNATLPSGKDLEEADIVLSEGDSIGKDNSTSHPEEQSTENQK